MGSYVLAFKDIDKTMPSLLVVKARTWVSLRRSMAYRCRMGFAFLPKHLDKVS